MFPRTEEEIKQAEAEGVDLGDEGAEDGEDGLEGGGDGGEEGGEEVLEGGEDGGHGFLGFVLFGFCFGFLGYVSGSVSWRYVGVNC